LKEACLGAVTQQTALHLSAETNYPSGRKFLPIGWGAASQMSAIGPVTTTFLEFWAAFRLGMSVA
jgi:hypothetical protein